MASKDEMFPCESRVNTPEFNANYDRIFASNSAAVVLPDNVRENRELREICKEVEDDK